jgi:hypothetical protein
MSPCVLQQPRATLLAASLVGAIAGCAMARTPGASSALPSEPEGIPAALDAAITGPADEDHARMKALLLPEARLMFVSRDTNQAPIYRIETVDDWIARIKARGHAMLEERQREVRIERYGNIAHVWSNYTLQSDGKQVARGITSVQAIKGVAGWRVAEIMVQAESVPALPPKEPVGRWGPSGHAEQ